MVSPPGIPVIYCLRRPFELFDSSLPSSSFGQLVNTVRPEARVNRRPSSTAGEECLVFCNLGVGDRCVGQLLDDTPEL